MVSASDAENTVHHEMSRKKNKCNRQEVNTICTYLHPRNDPKTIQGSANISKSTGDLATLRIAQARATTSPRRSVFVGI